MENELLEIKETEKVNTPTQPYVISEKMKATIDAQIKYRDAHWDEILAKAKELDEELAQCEKLVTDEDEIAEIVSKDRRERYEASLRH